MEGDDVHDQESSLFGTEVNPEQEALLRHTSQWARFLSVTGFVLGIMMLVYGIIMYNKIIVAMRSSPVSAAVYRVAVRYLLVCFVFAAVFIVGAIFTLSFSSRTMAGLDNNDQSLINRGISSMRNAIILWSVAFVAFIALLLYLFSEILKS